MGSRKEPAGTGTFDVNVFLESAGVARRIVKYRKAQPIFRQGEAATSVMYVQAGGVKLSVLSKRGREAVVAILGPGQFIGEDALTGATRRLGNATTMEASTLLVIEKDAMIRALHERAQLSDRFIAHLLARNARVEADLVDQLFNSSEKRLARTLLLLARYGAPDGTDRVVPKVSQEVLADMVGTTRSRVNFFMNKFRKLGFLEYNGSIRINTALLSVVLHD
ncbi:MAG: crp 1 [Acidobacteria bacterium]|nr:crp 1 [Acidobacteriota bacterium]